MVRAVAMPVVRFEQAVLLPVLVRLFLGVALDAASGIECLGVNDDRVAVAIGLGCSGAFGGIAFVFLGGFHAFGGLGAGQGAGQVGSDDAHGGCIGRNCVPNSVEVEGCVGFLSTSDNFEGQTPIVLSPQST